MKSNKIKPEKQVREQLLRHARRIGAEEDLQQLYDKWDKALALAPPSEKKEMSKMAILEVQSLLDIHAEEHDGLTIDGEVIIPNKN
jgi:hypothetical protein